MPYLIDGNNLLGSWGGPAVPGDGRVEVVRRVAAFCRAKGARATLVFDGAPFRPELGGPGARAPSPCAFRAQGQRRRLADPRDRRRRASGRASSSSSPPTSRVYSYARTRGARALTRARVERARPRGGDAAAERSSRRSRSRAEPNEKPERETDVEGWLKHFSRE